MIKPSDPRQLAIDILERRSICNVKVGAVVVYDDGRILSWGWNHVGSGFGMHAEVYAIRRANKARLQPHRTTIYVASKRGNKSVMSSPCEACRKHIYKYNMKICYRDKTGEWIYER